MEDDQEQSPISSIYACGRPIEFWGMITPAQLAAESQALMKLLNDPRFADPTSQTMIAQVINELAWVNDGQAIPASEMIDKGLKVI